MSLQPIINELQAMHTDMAALGDSKLPVVEYFRPVQPNERGIDVRREAEEHGCIIAMRGSAFVIMPRLVKGWTQVSDTWRRG
jgi:hypothetical protein